jgi:hypothetical protein
MAQKQTKNDRHTGTASNESNLSKNCGRSNRLSRRIKWIIELYSKTQRPKQDIDNDSKCQLEKGTRRQEVPNIFSGIYSDTTAPCC